SFKDELAPMRVVRGVLDKQTGQVVGKEEHTIERDECNRPDTTLEGLQGLKPYFDPKSGQGTVTAGNASQLSDGASVALLMSRERAEALGVKPKGVFRGFAVAGCEPDEMGIGPVFAVPKLLKRHGLKMDDVGLWELNEAFAVQVVYCRDRLGIDPAVNALSPGVIDGLVAAVRSAQQDAAVKAVVLTGAGRIFCGGADINEFGKLTSGKKSIDEGFGALLAALEDGPKPVVCAI